MQLHMKKQMEELPYEWMLPFPVLKVRCGNSLAFQWIVMEKLWTKKAVLQALLTTLCSYSIHFKHLKSCLSPSKKIP